MNILELIQLKYLEFSIKEQKIADYILENVKYIENMNITVFAQNCNVSTATVTRFCQKLDCQSFVNLKIKLSSINLTSPSISTINDPLNKVYSFYKDILNISKDLVNLKDLEVLYDKIKSAKRIYIYGVGSSGLTGIEFMLRLIRMGFHCQAITDSHLMIINSSILNENDLVIALSSSGETLDVINAVKLAKKNKCFVASITSFPTSTLSENSDFFIIVPNPNLLTKNSFVNTQFSTLYIIDVLTTIFLQEDEMREKMNITINSILNNQNNKK
ncbi:MurR/RpiR family transcriptional regulator [[Clostridium] colinum]|uniref:MurR/RpiR family transcriptional regulator n=1 Tax=[Clostridium] colinum TaxID=36835 RepID=UPI0020251F8B|nr:MurR/RpiR family transcriptional regulator [[Clostridium] colinum]